MKCYECGEKITMDDSLGAEVKTDSKGKPVWKDVCDSCYRDIVETCQLCGSDDLMPSDVSRFILVKSELGHTADRPPGIYEIVNYPFLSIPMIGGGSMGHGDVIFVDCLPKSDFFYDISGHICKKCAKPYAVKRRAVYGSKEMTRYWNPKEWAIQREHIRSVILANPDMLRDLECETDEKYSDWADLKELFCLPKGIPTYHEWRLLKYKGVTVYMTNRDAVRGDGWLLLKPEPKYRRYAYGSWGEEPGVMFCASSLPTFKNHPDDGTYYSLYDWNKQQSLPAIRKAIALGLITQKGTFDKKGKPYRYG